jgi:hypothetical protein
LAEVLLLWCECSTDLPLFTTVGEELLTLSRTAILPVQRRTFSLELKKRWK